jgi:threonine dehydrogenase-like Zn-dependent dehydrogenase
VIGDSADAIVQITTSAICGTDLHFVRGTMPGMRPGTILGHEAVGVVEETGPQAPNFNPGDRVVIPSTIGCGSCVYCQAGYYAQCDNANQWQGGRHGVLRRPGEHRAVRRRAAHDGGRTRGWRHPGAGDLVFRRQGP